MANRLVKLNELHELLKSGAISQQEFEALKSEIINNENEALNFPIQETKTTEQENVNKEKISLKSFTDNDGIEIKAPNIQYVNFKDLSNEEIKLLKPFIREKQIYSPSEMTEDEINLGNKIFTRAEIDEMNSERSGFNHPWSSILSVLCAGISLGVVMISPCLIFVVGGSSFLCGLIFAITVLNKIDATKLDRIFASIGLILSVISVIIFINWKPLESSKSSNSKSESGQISLDCSNSTSEYSSGYSSGKLVKMMGDSETCEGFVRKTNEGTGRDVYSATDCFCEGFNDGKNGESEKYIENVVVEVSETTPTKVDSAQVSIKEIRWNEFYEVFNSAIAEKDKNMLSKITVTSNFSGDYLDENNLLADSLGDNIWEEINYSFSKGVKQKEDSSDMKITNDEVLIFIYENDKWFWMGFMGD